MFGVPNFMRAIDRVHAERQLMTALDEQMDWSEIELFFTRLHIPQPKMGSSYTLQDLIRAYLKECSDDFLLEIADQLGLTVASEKQGSGFIALGESKYWLIDHFRVFISHVHTAKAQAGALRRALQRYAISAFVAHDDIETSDEWRDEILRSLMSMDALVAVLQISIRVGGRIRKLV